MFFIQITIAESGKTVFLNPENIGYMAPESRGVVIVTNIPTPVGGTVSFTVQETMEELIQLIEGSENPGPNAMIG